MKIKAIIQVHNTNKLRDVTNNIITVIIDETGWVDFRDNPQLKEHLDPEYKGHKFLLLTPSDFIILLSKPYEN